MKPIKGLRMVELFGYAALDAMKDAGVEPRDVQYFFHGSANPHVLNHCITRIYRWRIGLE